MTRIILGEGVPKVIARRLRDNGLDAVGFPNGWKQLSNGLLLGRIEREGFDVLVTSDKQMQFQQAVTGRRLTVLVLPTNNRVALLKMLPEIVASLRDVQPGSFRPLISPGLAVPGKRSER